MTEARRTVARWWLAALIERGPGRIVHHWEVARLERPITPEEGRQIVGPHGWFRVFPGPRPSVPRTPVP